jgi:hypothetical protein
MMDGVKQRGIEGVSSAKNNATWEVKDFALFLFVIPDFSPGINQAKLA